MKNLIAIFTLITYVFQLHSKSDQATTNLTIYIGPQIIESNVLSPDIDMSSTSNGLEFPVANVTGNEKIIRQSKSGVRVNSLVPYSIMVSFEPIQDPNLLSWNEQDRFYLTKLDLSNETLWNGFSEATDKIFLEEGVLGDQVYIYYLTYVRDSNIRNGALEGRVTFTITFTD